MHQQIKASPDDTGTNMRRVINVLTRAGINIEGIAPDFEPPHVRVAVKQNHPYDPNDKNDTFNRALVALRRDGLNPQIVSSVPLVIPNEAGALQAAIDQLTREGYVVESILALAPQEGEDGEEPATHSVGVSRSSIAGWAESVAGVRAAIELAIQQGPDE